MDSLYQNNPQHATRRPWIFASEPDLTRISRQAIAALVEWNNEWPHLFEYAGTPVHIASQRDGGFHVRPMSVDLLRNELAAAVSFFTGTPDNSRSVRPPLDVVKRFQASADLSFPVVEMVVRHLVFSSTGELIENSGYSPSTRTFCNFDRRLLAGGISDAPDAHELQHCVRFVMKSPLGDFPFRGQSEKAHIVALMLQSFVRPMIKGPTPLYLISKPTPETGATLLAFSIAGILGCEPTILMEPRSPEEWSRKLLAAQLRSPCMVLIDNVLHPLDSGPLASLLTGDFFEDRVVGSSETARVRVSSLQLATANNPSLSDEIRRRAVEIGMDPGVERPHLRTGFKHPRLREWVKQSRGLLLWAFLTIVRAWVAKGMPQGRQVLGMYEDWSGVLGGILECAGVQGFLDEPHDRASEVGMLSDPMRGFLDGWHELHKSDLVSAAQLVDLAHSCGLDLGSGGDYQRATQLGTMLSKTRGRVFDGLRAEPAKRVNGSWRWRVVPVKGEAKEPIA